MISSDVPAHASPFLPVNGSITSIVTIVALLVTG